MSLPAIPDYTPPRRSELPATRVRWRPDPARTVLLVHDLQEYFVRPYGIGHTALLHMLQQIERIRQHCRAHDVPVLYTAQHGNQDPASRGLQAEFWGPGMPDDGIAPRIVERLAPAPQDRVFTKHRYSAFQRSALETHLRTLRRDQLVITGVYAHIGILLTAADAFMRDIEPFVIGDAVADFSRAHHDEALVQAARCCAHVVNASELLETW